MLCKYCEKEYGDVDNDLWVKLGKKKILEGLIMDVWLINGDSHSKYPAKLEFDIATDTCTLNYIRIPIKYCPFCGKKIKRSTL